MNFAFVVQPSLFWHDYETFGIDPRRDRPAQFAGVRTDADFNIIDDPVIVYCKPPNDYLPDPEACLLTGISPQIAEFRGVNEAKFCKIIHEQFARPQTCSLGYNTLRFDDEFTRNCLYRNFYDPYAREWQNGNSRWDLIDVVRAARALRPDGVSWPTDAEGRPSYKLQNLTYANGLAHESAHDALSDVFATIALAKLIKQAQPKLFDYLWRHKTKSAAYDLIGYGSSKPVVHISGRYPTSKHCLAVVLPICKHPDNANGIIVYDLSVDPGPLIDLTVEEIQNRIFTATADLPEGTGRIPLKTVHLNKCPVLAPLSVLKPEDQERLNLSLSACNENCFKINEVESLEEKISQVFTKKGSAGNCLEIDPDLAIYTGGFFSERDKQKMAKIRGLQPEDLTGYAPDFNDPRLTEMYFRYKARNFPDSLKPEEVVRWRKFCVERMAGLQAGGGISIEGYFNRLAQLQVDNAIDKEFANELENFAREKIQNLGYPLN